MITEAILHGHWLMLQVGPGAVTMTAWQNCHLCLEFCEEIVSTVVDTDDMHQSFR